MKTSRVRVTSLAIAPLALLVACGGGSGGGTTTDTTPQTQNPPTVTAALTQVPLGGDVVADCTQTGTGVIDSVINAVSALTGASLPTAIPHLSDVVAQADLSKLPVIGGLLMSSGGSLVPISAAQVTSLLPAGVLGLAALPVPTQLPVVCSSLVAFLPAGALNDPTALLTALGAPTNALGVIPVLNASNTPVGVLLATVPGGLVPGSGSGVVLPGVPQLPDLTSLVPLDASTVPVVGPTISSLTHTLLGLLNGHSLLSGGLLTLLLGLIP